MADDLFERLRSRQDSGEKSEYSFRGGDASESPFRRRTTKEKPKPRAPYRPGKKAPPKREARRDEDGDRPAAYQPPVVRDEGVMYEYEAPGMGEVFKRLGLRVFEVVLGAAARAAGDEVAYFFERKRFYTRQRRDRKDW